MTLGKPHQGMWSGCGDQDKLWIGLDENERFMTLPRNAVSTRT